MLLGRFGKTTGRPYLEGRLSLPRLGIDASISFLVDTGADGSVLHPTDALRIGIDYSQLTGDSVSTGTAGPQRYFVEPVVIFFTEPRKRIHGYAINIDIAPPSPEIMEIPSLLGRDILDRWRMHYSPPTNRLSFQVVTSDFSIPVP